MIPTNGTGDPTVAHGLYEVAVRREVSAMRREGVYVCFAIIMERMPSYNRDILWNVLWTMARNGGL